MTFKQHFNKKRVQEESIKGMIAGAGLGLATMLSGQAKPNNSQATQTYSATSNITQEDIIAATLVLEARGEGVKGMQAVYEVIMNRAKKEGKSPSKIVLAPKQFSCFNNANIPALVQKVKTQFAKSFDTAMQIVKSSQTNHTKGARWYHTTNIKPTWAKTLLKSGAIPTTIGRHVFYSSSKLR